MKRKIKQIKKIGILGGTFNPIHNGHISISKIAKEALLLDEIWIMPTYKTPLKNTIENNVSVEHRIKMIKLAIKEHSSWLKLLTYETDAKITSFSYDSLKFISEKYPYYEIYFIIGSDTFSHIEQWYKHKEINRFVDFVIIKRNDEVSKDKLEEYDAKFLNITEVIPTSSTKVRNGESLDIHLKVKQYISKHYLYIKNIVANELSDKRTKHSLLVGATCRQLAYNYKHKDLNEAYYAGISHDLTKEKDIEWHKNFLSLYSSLTKEEIENIHPNILHAYSGSFWMKYIYKINNDSFIRAIMYHSTGSKHMTTLDKIVYISDKISHSNDDYKENIIKQIALESLDLALCYILELNYQKNIELGKVVIDKNTLDAYKKYVHNKPENLLKAKKRFDELLTKGGGNIE